MPENNLYNLFKEYYANEKYIVDDIGLNCEETREFIFVLESPHNEEVEKNCSVVGSSGKEMAKFLRKGSGESLGEYAKKNLNSKISIINVSKVPLQKTKNLNEEYGELTKYVFPIIRCRYDSYRNHRKDVMNDIEKYILDDFKKRINSVSIDSNTKFIICGSFAQKYFNDAINDIINEGIFKEILDEYYLKENILFVPHPSRHQWLRAKNDLNKLEKLFKQSND